MTPEQTKALFADLRDRRAVAIGMLSEVPEDELRAVLRALDAFLEFDEEGVKELIAEAVTKNG